MPKSLVAVAVIVTAGILAAVIFGPSLWLTRTVRGLRFRRVRPRTILLLWIAAVAPWVGAFIYFHFARGLSVGAHSLGVLLLVLLAALLAIAAFVSLPVAVIVLSVVWLLDRGTQT
ncbi:MAG: hypothetical protein M3R65_03155 [Gemmatimonadota bacterium]|nr:hypothetical protein [Gemmatimonadota bacterium]